MFEGLNQVAEVGDDPLGDVLLPQGNGVGEVA